MQVRKWLGYIRKKREERHSTCHVAVVSRVHYWIDMLFAKKFLGLIGHGALDNLVLLGSQKCLKIRLRSSISHHIELGFLKRRNGQNRLLSKAVIFLTRRKHRQYLSTHAPKWSKEWILWIPFPWKWRDAGDRHRRSICDTHTPASRARLGKAFMAFPT